MEPSNQNILPNIPEEPYKATPSRSKLKIILAVFVVAVVAFVVAVWIWQFQKNSNQNQFPTPPGNIIVPAESNNPTPAFDPNINQPYEYDPLSQPVCQYRLETTQSKTDMVTWHSPERIRDLTFFAPYAEDNTNSWEDVVYKVGKVLKGKYENGDIYLVYGIESGPSGPSIYRIIGKDNQYFLLNKYSSPLPEEEWGAKMLIKPTQDKDFDLPDLNFPAKLTLENPSLNLSYPEHVGFNSNGSEFFCADNLKQVHFDAEVGGIYTELSTPDDGFALFGFYIKSPDGTKHTYTLDVPFIGKDRVPLITWLNNTINKEEYSYQELSGCGASKFLDVAENVSEKELKQTGTTINGNLIFEYADQNHLSLKTFYEEHNLRPDGQRYTYQEFLSLHPLFFWQEPLGRYVRFANLKFQPLGECAKPVIYLYPTTTQTVSVKVEPVGGMLVSHPAYGNGWTVKAQSNGTLTNLKDGLTYPYLFWEGRGGLYIMPKVGFVVARQDLEASITEKLSLHGLNSKEISDFLEYWLPLMQDKPYYFITFLNTKQVDILAPLTITPKPDTIIRVVMDFEGLDAPVTVPDYQIYTPQRNGFSVIEWGGVKRK